MKNTLSASLLLTVSVALVLTAQQASASDELLTADDQVEATPIEAVQAEAIPTEITADETPAGPQILVTEATEPLTPAGEPISMDRSDWPTIVILPEDGSVTHNPHYMGNVAMGEDEVGPLHAPEPVWQIQEALSGADAGNYNGENLSALGAQPFIGLVQFVLIPVHAVFEQPWSEATSP